MSKEYRIRTPIPLRQAARFLAPVLGLWLCADSTSADSVKPFRFGPYLLNDLNISANPFGHDYVLSNGTYRFQVGWMEPLILKSGGLFHETYFETNGSFSISPYQADLGTTFNFKPIRYWEIGLSYNRLQFMNSMAAFVSPGVVIPPDETWRPEAILENPDRQQGGADIFTYQTNITVDAGRLQFYLSFARALWDIAARGKDFVYEYGNDLLIQPRDRVNFLSFQTLLHSRPDPDVVLFSYSGFLFRDQYWNTSHTKLQKNLVSAGISGFRFGRNLPKQSRGLDLCLGYWTLHDQIPEGHWVESVMILADCTWNFRFLNL